MAYPQRLRPWVSHLVLGGLTVAAGVALTRWFRDTTTTQPARGYTTLGITLGILASVLFVGALLYSLRKRAGQEWMPARLQTWLRCHVWLSVLGVWVSLLHAGFHFDDPIGTLTFTLLALTVASGLAGWWLYRAVPPRVAESEAGTLAIEWSERQLREARAELDRLAAGASQALRAKMRTGTAGRRAVGVVAPGEETLLERAQELRASIDEWTPRLARQRKLRRWLRAWLWVHIPASLVFVVAVLWHVFDALEVVHAVRAPRPGDFASPESCLPCHQTQYDEWIHSMHAMAMSAPTVDIQNRLVLAKERRDVQAGGPRLVGDLCVRCHAPTGSQPWLKDAEGPLTKLADRSPASRFGISCVTCHQVTALHPSDPSKDRFARDASGGVIRFRNADNLAWTPGRAMHGPFGQRGTLPSVGNASHEGIYNPAFESAELCASCHTVTVDDPHTGRQVRLQDTFREWEDGGSRKNTGVNWAREGVRCMHCHARDLDTLAQVATRMEREDVSLRDRRRRIVDLLRAHVVERPLNEPAALPADGFDLPLPPRRRFRHDFTGVDVPLDKNAPFPPGHARHGENPAIRKRMIARTTQLLRIAAAVQIQGIRGDDLVVDVMNLATGHKLPAGFAFARELWLEVATRRLGGAWRVHLGGRDGRPLEATERLAKQAEGLKGLKNFQAVLWNGGRGDKPGIDGLTEGETVIQNEVVKVLTGKDARAQGFTDRVGFLLPGEIRSLRIPLSSLGRVRKGDEVRVRLRFRNFPPEFLTGLAARAARELSDVDHARASRLRDGLHIIDVARDTFVRR